MKPKWSGYYARNQVYLVGEVVVYNFHVFMARNMSSKQPEFALWEKHGDWIHLGKQENGKVDHFFFPEGIQIPLPSGDLSEKTYVCADCWKNHNFAAAFMADEHAYLINELP